ncbi:MAG: hypothetical protein ACJ743_09990 [Gaiellaceae bacterium]
MGDDEEGLEPIETEPLTGSDEVDDSLLGIETNEEFRTGSSAAKTIERDDS